MRKISIAVVFVGLTALQGCGYFDKSAKEPQPVVAGDITALEKRAAAIQNDAASLRKDLIDLGNRPGAVKTPEAKPD